MNNPFDLIPVQYRLLAKIAAIALLVIALISAYEYWHYKVDQGGYNRRVAEEAGAVVTFDKQVTEVGNTAVTGVLKNENEDRPAVDAAAADILRLCTRGVPSATRTGISDAAGTGTKNGGESQGETASTEITGQDTSDDIETCNTQLNLFRGLQVERRGLSAIKVEGS